MVCYAFCFVIYINNIDVHRTNEVFNVLYIFTDILMTYVHNIVDTIVGTVYAIYIRTCVCTCIQCNCINIIL